MAETTFDAVSEAADEQATTSGGSGPVETPAGLPERDEVDAPLVNVRPRSMVKADRTYEFAFNGEITAEQNIRDADTQYEDFTIIVLENPTLEHGELWKSTDDEQGQEYKLVGPADDGVEEVIEEVDGEYGQVGIRPPNGNKFYAEQVEDFEEDYVKFFISGGQGQRLTRVLDTFGGEYARYDPSEVEHDEDYDASIDGIVELPPDDDSDLLGRIGRTPDLRQDMIDRPIRFQWDFGEQPDDASYSRPQNVSVFALGEDAPPEGELLEPLTRDDDAWAPPRHSTYMVWHDPSDALARAQGDDSASSSTSTSQSTSATDSAQTTTVDGYDDLSETGQDFVDDFLSGLEDNDLTTDDIEDLEATVSEAATEHEEETGESIDVDDATLTDIVYSSEQDQNGSMTSENSSAYAEE